MRDKTSRKIDPGLLLGLTLFAALVLARLFLFSFFTIPSGSMEPTVMPGDYVIASKFAYGPTLGHAPQRGDLVLYRMARPTGMTTYIKRLIGLPGDQVQLKHGVVYLNGVALQRQAMGSGTEIGPFGLTHPVLRFREMMPDGRSYVVQSYGPDSDAENTGVYVVPAGRYFMMGDNRDNSADSRFPEAIGGGYASLDHFVARADLAISFGGKTGQGRPDLGIRRLH